MVWQPRPPADRVRASTHPIGSYWPGARPQTGGISGAIRLLKGFGAPIRLVEALFESCIQGNEPVRLLRFRNRVSRPRVDTPVFVLQRKLGCPSRLERRCLSRFLRPVGGIPAPFRPNCPMRCAPFHQRGPPIPVAMLLEGIKLMHSGNRDWAEPRSPERRFLEKHRGFGRSVARLPDEV